MAVLVICVYLILKLTLVAGQPGAVHYVLKGREAFLSPGLPKAPDDILWKHNGDKVITFDSAEELVFPPYESRVTLAWDTAELTIADVGYEDSGEYELDAFIRDKLHRSQHMLKVLDKVSKPVIRCEMTDGSGNSTSVRGTLHCSSDSNTPEVLTFKWNLEGKSHLGQALSIALGDEHDHIEYSCTASNPLHAETSVFMAKDCLAEERSSKALDVIVPIVIASLILLAFCIFPFIFRHQIKRACFRREKSDDLEKHIGVADKSSSLKGDIHRQETFASKQPLIQQNDEASPQRQEIMKELKELRSSGKVKKFKKPEEGNDTDRVETVAAQPASPIRNGQVDSEGETDRDTHSDQTETQALLSKPDEHESRGKTDSTGVLDAHHSDREDVQKSEVTGDSSSIHSGQEEDTGAPEQAGLAESNEKSEPIEPESKEQLSPDEDSPPAPEDPLSNASHNENVNLDHTEAEESEQSSDSQMPPPHSELSESQPQSAYQHPADLEDREKTGPVEQTKPGPADKDPQGDSDHEGASSNNKAKKAEDAAPTDVLSSSPDSESPGLAESNEKSKPIEPERKEQLSPDEDSPSAPEDSLRDASHNENVNLDHTKAEESKQSSDSQMPPPHSELSESQPQSAYQHPADLEDREKTGPVEQTKPGPADKDPQGDSDHEGASSNNKAKKAEDAAPTDVLSSSPDSESPVDGALSQSDQNQHSHSGPNIEEVRDDKESDSSTDSSSEESKESKQTSTTDITPTGEPEPELQSQSQTDSGGETGEALNTDAVDDSSSSHSDQEEATVTPEQAGLEKESAESTHPPASALSKRS